MDDDTDRHASNGRAKGHMPNGKFAPSNSCSPGNPNARKMFELRRAILDSSAASPEAIRAAFSRLFRRAVGRNEDKDGSSVDMEAMKLYLSYSVGRPIQAVELSGPDGEPLGLNISQVHAVIVAALGDDQDAKHRVARALLSLGAPGGDGGPDDAAGA